MIVDPMNSLLRIMQAVSICFMIEIQIKMQSSY